MHIGRWYCDGCQGWVAPQKMLPAAVKEQILPDWLGEQFEFIWKFAAEE